MIYAVTNRNLVEGGETAFLKQIEKIAAARPDGIILREKDLQPLEYELLAKKCQVLCNAYETPLIVNHFHEVSQKIFNRRIHLSMAAFKELVQRPEGIGKWKCLGVSVHSREEALYAEENGADYVIAGHIFLTDCKKGLAARGLDFLEEICDSINIPVFAIGGMDLVHGPMALEAGAAGICMMSELMKSKCPEEIIKRFSGRSL